MRAFDSAALTTSLLAGNTVYHPWCCAGDVGVDGVGVTSVVTLPTILLAGNTVDHPWCCAGDAGADGVGVPSVVTGV